MNTDLRKKAKNNFEKDFIKLINNAAFGKTMENVRKNTDIKLVTRERRKNYLVSETSYHTTKFFTENLLAIETKKKLDSYEKSVYLGLPILELSKILVYEIWYNYVKPKYGKKAKLCYEYNFIVYIKQKIFIKILQKMLKLDLILQIMN